MLVETLLKASLVVFVLQHVRATLKELSLCLQCPPLCLCSSPSCGSSSSWQQMAASCFPRKLSAQPAPPRLCAGLQKAKGRVGIDTKCYIKYCRLKKPQGLQDSQAAD